MSGEKPYHGRLRREADRFRDREDYLSNACTWVALRVVRPAGEIGAEEASRIGLVDEVVPHDELREKTLELAAKIAAKSPLTVRIAKEAMRASERMSVEDGIVYERDLFCLCFSTEDKEEGVAAFLEKRAAEWKGR